MSLKTEAKKKNEFDHLLLEKLKEKSKELSLLLFHLIYQIKREKEKPLSG